MKQRPAQQQSAASTQGTLLLLQVPRTNEQKELAAEQMFASLHGLLSMPLAKANLFSPRLKREGLSFEIAVINRRIGFYVWVPDYIKSFVEEQIYAQYPTVQISEVDDYASDRGRGLPEALSAELKLIGNDVLPIKTFQSFDVDPLAAITATLAKFEEDEEAWVQLVIRPAALGWHRKSERYLARSRSGKTPVGEVFSLIWQPTDGKARQAGLPEHEQLRAEHAKAKSQKLAFEAQIRIVYRGGAPVEQARLRLQSIIASYKQFNTTYLNGFTAVRIGDDQVLLDAYRSRQLGYKGGFSLNIEEVATLYHLPHTNVQTPYILWASSQTAEPPANLPIITDSQRADVSPVAATNFRAHQTVFGLPRGDRSRHLYIIGQTGVGKSGLLELLTLSDIYSPHGFAVIDPHGDYAQSVLRRIPADRVDDVIYFNPADTDFPLAFNPMEVLDPKLKTHTATELIGVLKRMFESWGPRLEHILRHCLLALLDYPEATMLDITPLLTDGKFRAKVLSYVQDPVVRNFWMIEFASWNERFAAEAVAPVLNKVGAFTANPLVRNIIGQPKSSFNIRQIMDERKILIVNLARGLLGEDNAALLGGLLVTKVQLGAMSRADLPAPDRIPFDLYVDEFQNFATDSFVTILSEARKYGLNLTVANQYISQMPPDVRDAVFGNVGSIIAFRMSADDARSMLRYFAPKFEEYDLIHMHNRHFLISMTIDGEKVPGFSGITLELPPQGDDHTAAIVQRSRVSYASHREDVERFVNNRYLDEGPRLRQVPPKPVAVSSAKPVRSKHSLTVLGKALVAAGLARQPTAPAAPPIAESVPDAGLVAQPHDQRLATKPKRRRRRGRKTSTAVGNAPKMPGRPFAASSPMTVEPSSPRPKPAGTSANTRPRARRVRTSKPRTLQDDITIHLQ